MSHLIWENKEMRILSHENEIFIGKKKYLIRKEFFLLFLLPVVFGSIIFWLTKIGDLKMNKTVISYILFAAFSFYFVYSYLNILRKTLKNIKDCKIQLVKEDILINEIFFCKTNELSGIIVQPILGEFGLGASFTLGVKSKIRAIPIAYFLGEKESNRVAKIIADYFKTEILIQKPFFFSWFRQW